MPKTFFGLSPVKDRSCSSVAMWLPSLNEIEEHVRMPLVICILTEIQREGAARANKMLGRGIQHLHVVGAILPVVFELVEGVADLGDDQVRCVTRGYADVAVPVLVVIVGLERDRRATR